MVRVIRVGVRHGVRQGVRSFTEILASFRSHWAAVTACT